MGKAMYHSAPALTLLRNGNNNSYRRGEARRIEITDEAHVPQYVVFLESPRS